MAITYTLTPSSVIEVTLFARMFAQRIMTTLHYEYIAGAPATDGPAAVLDLITKCQTRYTGIAGTLKTLQSTDVIYDWWQGQVVHPTRRPFIFYLDGGTGSVDAPAGTADVAVAVHRRPIIVGRGRTGTLHIAGAAASEMNNGTWSGTVTGAAMTFANSTADELAGPFDLTFWRPIIWSPRKPLERNEVFDVDVDNRVRVMRRRTVGYGI